MVESGSEKVDVWVNETSDVTRWVRLSSISMGALLEYQRITLVYQMEAMPTHRMGPRKQQKRAVPQDVQRRPARCKRSGGFLVAVTPDGFVTDAFEFMGAKSRSQRFLLLARWSELYPDLGIVCRVCHLRRFAQRFTHHSPLAG